MEEFSNIQKALDDFGDEYIKELTKQLIALDKVATGKLLRSLSYKVVERVEGQFELILEAESYLRFVDKGRKASGKMPPVQPFIKWVQAKGVKFKSKTNDRFLTTEQTAFVIARSLKTKDIKPTNVMKKALKNVLYMKERILKNGAKLDLENLVSKVLFEK